jgi:hypothetical protein
LPGWTIKVKPCWCKPLTSGMTAGALTTTQTAAEVLEI